MREECEGGREEVRGREGGREAGQRECTKMARVWSPASDAVRLLVCLRPDLIEFDICHDMNLAALRY